MKRNKLLLMLFLPMLLFLPFGNYAQAQVPTYVGVAVGDQYTWDAQVEFGNVDTLLANVKDVLEDWQANINSLTLFGLESLTIPEIYEIIAVSYFSNVLPVGWEGLNNTDLVIATITDYIEDFNATFLSGMIPSNWLSLNFSDFYDLVFDGINATLLPGWENNPMPDLWEISINALNSTILYGLIPNGWESMTLGALFNALLATNAPLIGESFVVQTIFDSLISGIMSTDMLDDTITDLFDQIVSFFPSYISSLNATALFDQMFMGINQTFPGGIESENMTAVLDFLAEASNSSLPSEYSALNMSSLLDMGIEALVNMTSLPTSILNLTIVGILDMGFTEAIIGIDSAIAGWSSAYTMLQGMGMASIQAGLRVVINSIGTETSYYPGGPMGVPINMDYFASYASSGWLNISELMGIPGGISPIGLMFGYFMGGSMFMGDGPALIPAQFEPPISMMPIIAITPHIVNPSTYSSAQIALTDQFLFTGALIVANNYDWPNVLSDLTFVTPGNPDAIEMTTSWTTKGVLSKAEIKTDGLVVAVITLIGEESGEIPGFEIPIILGISSIALIAIIYHMKRKNKIIK